MPRPLPPLNALRAFEAAARLGGVSAAATELSVTHGAISRQIKLLEAELGMPLFARAGRGLRLTAAGARLGEATGTALAQLQSAVAELRRDAAPAALVLACPGSLLARWVIPCLPALERALPDLKLHLSAHEGSPDSAPAGADALLAIGRPPWPQGWKAHALAAERIGPVLSPRHPDFATLSAQAAGALAGLPLLHTASRPQAWPEWASLQGLDPASLRYGAGFAHLFYLLEAAIAGLGVAIAPEPLVAADIAAGRLAAPWGFTATGAAWTLCAPGERDDPRIAALARWLTRQLQDGHSPLPE